MGYYWDDLWRLQIHAYGDNVTDKNMKWSECKTVRQKDEQ